MAYLPIAGLVIQELVVAGIGLASAVALFYGYEKAKTTQQAKALELALSRNKKQQQTHRPWQTLEPFQGKVRRGKSSKGKTYYYQKDMLHGDVEVYKLQGSKGIHIGSVSMAGGPLTKPAVQGRNIKL